MKKILMLLAALVCMISLQATTVTVTPYGYVGAVTVDGTTYNNLPITTQGDIHLITINQEGISLLVRYTDTNTVSAIGTVNGQSFNYASAAVTDYAKSFQIPNSDFEEWHQVYKSGSTTLYEPGAEGTTYSWHGFGTCNVTNWLTGSARTGSRLYSDNHDGGKCAVIETASVLGFIANGTMTTGRLQAGATTASDTRNHAEMDITKTYTDDYAKYGPFYVLLNAKPDAIKSSLQVSLNNPDHKASLSAAITDGSYYQEPRDKEYTNVAATAGSTTIPTSVDWQDYTFDFNYNAGVDANAIMVTISTNANPGEGTSGDKVYVDDVELIYNAAIRNIALNGVALEGFNFNTATKSYDITYSGEALNLTADNFVVTAVGQSAIVVKNVENLGCGNYRIAIGVTSPDFKNGDLYTINVTKRPVWILGEVNNHSWAANDGEQMTTEDGIVYTAEVTFDGRNEGKVNYFSFTTELANDNDEGGWAYISPFRFGASSNGDFVVTDEQLDKELTLTYENGQAFKIPKGDYTLNVNLATMKLVITRNSTGIVGDVDGDGNVDVTDVNLVVNIILGKAQFANYPNADVDGDGVVDVTDVNKVVNIILGKN